VLAENDVLLHVLRPALITRIIVMTTRFVLFLLGNVLLEKGYRNSVHQVVALHRYFNFFLIDTINYILFAQTSYADIAKVPEPPSKLSPPTVSPPLPTAPRIEEPPVPMVTKTVLPPVPQPVLPPVLPLVPPSVPTFSLSNSASICSSTGGEVPVVFCGGNFEGDVPPNQDVGFEFGFNVMENMTYQAPPPPLPPPPVVISSINMVPLPGGIMIPLMPVTLDASGIFVGPSEPQPLGINPFLYYPPINFFIPTPSTEVQQWMDGCENTEYYNLFIFWLPYYPA
jgi:hypothetical protein